MGENIFAFLDLAYFAKHDDLIQLHPYSCHNIILFFYGYIMNICHISLSSHP